MAQFAYAKMNDLTTDEDYCFNLRYLLSCAIHKIKPSFWHDEAVKRDPKIRDFMSSLNLEIVIDEKDFASAKRKDPATYQMRVEVSTKGEIIKGVNSYLKGTWEPEQLRNTDDELLDKFAGNVSKIMPEAQALKVSEAIFELEKIDKVAHLVEMLA